MPQVIAYLGFDGTCAEAMRFYEQTLGGKLEVLLRSADTPMAPQMPPEWGDRIMHARLVLPGGGVLYAGDAPTHVPFEGIKGVSIICHGGSSPKAIRSAIRVAAQAVRSSMVEHIARDLASKEPV